MSITAAATRVFTTSTINVNSSSWGIVSQRDGSYLFGWTAGTDDFPFPSVGSWLRSTNDGRSWFSTGDSHGLVGQADAHASNIKGNIIVAPFFLPPTNQAGIMRSINQGLSWTDELTASIAASPNGRSVFCNGVESYDKTSAVAWGALEGTNTNPPQTWATSTDSGHTWTTHSSWDIATPFDSCEVIGVGQEGHWIASYIKGHTDPRFAFMAYTQNFGTSWTVGASMGSVTSPPFDTGRAICCFDKFNAAMAGSHSNSPPDGNIGAWWTNDQGASMNLLSNGDIINWPGGSGNMLATEVKRLTQDACFLAFENQNGGTPGSCWRLSLDKGHTYEIEVTQDGPISTYQIPCGNAVVTREGALLMALWQSETYDDSEISLWRAPIRCT